MKYNIIKFKRIKTDVYWHYEETPEEKAERIRKENREKRKKKIQTIFDIDINKSKDIN